MRVTEGLEQQQIVPIAADNLVVTARTAIPAHLAAILLGPDGAIHDETDFVFGSQAEAQGLRLAGPGVAPAPTLHVDLSSIPHAATTVRVVVALDNPHRSFAEADAPAIEVADGRGDSLYRTAFDGLGTASAVVAVDIERTGAGWGIATVGRGHAGGFAAVLAESHVQVGRRAAAREQVDAAVLPEGRPIGLLPGQVVRLRTSTGPTLDLVRLGLGWDPVPGHTHVGGAAAPADLDAAALLFDHDHHLLDAVYFAQLNSNDGSVRHLGDSMTGEGGGENEVITVDLSRIHPQVATVVLVVTSYHGHSFDTIRNAFCRLVDAGTGAELAHLDLHGGGPHTGMVMAKLYLAATGWKLQAVGEPIFATHPGEAVHQLTHHLA
ncbi:stress protein [Nocardia cyriacigeorgica]|uniref:Stress protein n=1 Tax=Nocardia cyriacigeorgica TaxID=135487 RepID=A0ABX0CFJ1_9NOCA|nr:TerD family protein [Nocardia cyriacigeorgica]NEW39953.1 stress protein [Nocardia cyriacigeorgica]NEW51436.1 stress protein [Nocardia cyriacigeorgica]NEW55328.1 stress protein [Nocardia cyriacigeorgica]